MLKKIKASFYELKSVKNLCVISFLMVLKVLISSFKIVISSGIQISFGFLIYIVVGCLFGPFVAFIFGLVSYIFGFVCGFSLYFHIGFLFSTIVSCFIYSLFLYKYNFSVKRVILATFLNDMLVHFFLNIIWLSQLFHNNNFFEAFVVRLPKSFVMLLVDFVLSCLVVSLVKKVVKI